MEAPNVIIKDVPRMSDGEIDRAFMREIQLGYKLERERKVEEQRLLLARKNARKKVGKVVPGLGVCEASLPARDFFRMIKNYSQDEVTSSEFLRFMRKDNDLRDLVNPQV